MAGASLMTPTYPPAKTCKCGKHENMYGHRRITGSSLRVSEKEIHSTEEACVVIIDGNRWVLSAKGTTVGQNLDAGPQA